MSDTTVVGREGAGHQPLATEWEVSYSALIRWKTQEWEGAGGEESLLAAYTECGCRLRWGCWVRAQVLMNEA